MADGKIVYQGLAFDAANYFSNLGFKSSRFSNPADIFMRVLAVQYPKSEEDVRKLELFNKCYNEKQALTTQAEMDEFTCPPMKDKKLSDVVAPFGVQMEQLMIRSKIFARREP